VNIGFILERIAPAMKAFEFDRNDCRSLFDPIDYIIFSGLTCHGKVDRLIFADIKTGNARLSAHHQRTPRKLKALSCSTGKTRENPAAKCRKAWNRQ
jgi:predicted Holliday junction resolvase-like endonuclease